MKLTYYVKLSEQTYAPIYTYSEGSIDPNEIYARQLCEYLVINGIQYQLLSNEMKDEEEILIVEKLCQTTTLPDEYVYDQEGIHIEFREYQSPTNMPLLYTLNLDPFGRAHWEAIRYLLKDYVDIPTIGLRKRDSAEIDEDRRCYVLYVTSYDT
ncbi:hypothetical protein ACFDTO_25315 [Microbacteriaceae bacterium 4G12]